MAKKTRSGRPQPGGRVTPKGGSRTTGDQDRGTAAHPHPGPGDRPQRIEPTHVRVTPAHHAPTRAGHHRGQR